MNPEDFSNFYTSTNLGFDLKLVEEGFNRYKKYFYGKNCLELGPASGYMTKLLISQFDTVTAVEGSKSLYDLIPEYSNLIKINSLFEDFNPNQKYDTIILNHVLEHIEKPVDLLLKIKDWLSPGGLLIVGVPNAKSFHRLVAVKMGLLNSEYDLNERDKELGHYRVYDFKELICHSEIAGYKIVDSGGIFLKFLSNNQIEKFLSEEIINAYFNLSIDFKENAAEIFLILKSSK